MRHPILAMVLNGGLSCRIGSRIEGAINFGAISEVPPFFATNDVADARQQRQTTKLIGILTNF
jgi:hypothetical protein